MTKLIVFLIAFGSFAFIQAEDSKKEDHFKERKEKMLKHLDNKIKATQAHRDCVASSNSKDEFKSCKKKLKETIKSMRKEAKE